MKQAISKLSRLALVGALAVGACTEIAVDPVAIGQLDSPLDVVQSVEGFAQLSGEVTSPRRAAYVSTTFQEGDLATPRSGGAMVAVVAATADGSSLDPGFIQVVRVGRRRHDVSEFLTSDVARTTDSLAFATLTEGTYEFWVRGERGTTGSFTVELSLVGDVDGDHSVTDDDLQRVVELQGARRGCPEYVEVVDVDRDGRIDRQDVRFTRMNLGAATALGQQHVDPLEEQLPPDALALVGLSPTQFNPRTNPIRFEVTGTEFSQLEGEVSLEVNGNLVPSAQVSVVGNVVEAPSLLLDGKNEVSLVAFDDVGRPLYYDATIWAGSSQLQVNLVDANGNPFTSSTTITAKLSDDNEVRAEGSSSNGGFAFQNLPARTILLEARGVDNSFGTQGVLGTQGVVQLVMSSFGTTSSVDNNDFSLGTDGWSVGNSPVSIVPHVEGPDVPVAGLAAPSAFAVLLPRQEARVEPPLMAPAEPTSEPKAPARVQSAALVDNDLLLSTGGEGEQRISRTFETAMGTTAVRLRYRFVTTEVPGGYFGSQFNDYFAASIRTQSGSAFANESNSMNGLGLAAFDYASGATDWRELTLQSDPQGDTIQVELAVANVGDGLYPSQVLVDFVQEVQDQVRPSLAWNASQGGIDLSYQVVDGPLEADVTIEVSWAAGAGYADRLGATLFTYVVTSGTSDGQYGPLRIEGDLLQGDPAGASHLVASSSPTSLFSLADVRITYGAQANAAVVSAAMVDAVKDSLRSAGQSAATITSTARTPTDQARAMFNNIVNTGAATQYGIYAAAGDAVIDVYVAETAGMTAAEIQANAVSIRQAMTAEIEAQGPSNVSRHCADPALVSVVDVGAGAFNLQNGPLFVAAAEARVTRFIDERQTNNCYHLELE